MTVHLGAQSGYQLTNRAMQILGLLLTERDKKQNVPISQRYECRSEMGGDEGWLVSEGIIHHHGVVPQLESRGVMALKLDEDADSTTKFM